MDLWFGGTYNLLKSGNDGGVCREIVRVAFCTGKGDGGQLINDKRGEGIVEDAVYESDVAAKGDEVANKVGVDVLKLMSGLVGCCLGGSLECLLRPSQSSHHWSVLWRASELPTGLYPAR